MSFRDHIEACNHHNLEGCRRFRIDGAAMGWIRPDLADRLRAFPDVFAVRETTVDLASNRMDPGGLGQAVETVLRGLRDDGLEIRWRDEPYAVHERIDDPPAMLLDRGAIPLFGARAYGVHVNGFVPRDDGIHLWIAKRATDRMVEPGKLDNMVAGGQPAGLSPMQNLIKEAAEEASIPPRLAETARAAGYVSYAMDRPDGLRRDVLFVYDLEMPDNFTPTPGDSEVESFTLMPLQEVARLVDETEAFKFNCNLVIIDFLVRHGFLDPGRPGYMDLVGGLRR